MIGRQNTLIGISKIRYSGWLWWSRQQESVEWGVCERQGGEVYFFSSPLFLSIDRSSVYSGSFFFNNYFKFIFSPLRHRISLLIPIFVLFGAQRRRINCGEYRLGLDCGEIVWPYGASKIWMFFPHKEFRTPIPPLYSGFVTFSLSQPYKER